MQTGVASSSSSSSSAVLQGGTVWPARAAAAGTGLVFLLLLGLHAIKPELDPSWRFLSEYATGQSGWIMRVTFVIWAASCAALAAAAKPHAAGGRRGRIGVAALQVVAVALVFAGLFPQDPVTTRPEDGTTAGMIHAIASLIGIPGIPLAAVLLSSALGRSSAEWGRQRTVLMGAAQATWISLVLMIAYLAWAVPRAGGFQEGVFAGWMNRLVVATYLAWQWVVASRLRSAR